MQIELSENATRFLNKLFPSIMLKADDTQFLIDAQAISEIVNAVKPQEVKDHAASELQQ